MAGGATGRPSLRETWPQSGPARRQSVVMPGAHQPYHAVAFAVRFKVKANSVASVQDPEVLHGLACLGECGALNL